MVIKLNDYLISKVDNIIEYCNAIKNVINSDNKIDDVYLFEKIDLIEENLSQIKEIKE